MRNVFARDIESLGRSWIHVQVFRLGERGGRGERHLSRAPGGRCARRSGLRNLGGALRGRRSLNALGLGLLPFLTGHRRLLVQVDERAFLVAHDDVGQPVAIDVRGNHLGADA